MPAASYNPIPGPAFYTGHLYHQPQHQPVAVSLSHQHQHQLATLEQRAAAASRSGPQWQEVYGQLNDKLEPPPLVATRLADAADTGKVLGCNRLDKSTQHNDSSVDRRQLTSDTCGGGPIREHDEGATTPPPRNNSNGNSNNGTALDSGAILNRSPSQQQQQPRRLESSQDSATATTQSSGSSSLIVSADNEIKNDIITSEHNKRQPLNEPAIVASANAGFGNGNDDEDVGKHVKPSNQLEVALDRFKCQQSRAQGRPDSASVLAATTTTAADHLCQSSVDSQRINREEEENEEEDSCQQDCGIKISLIDTKDKPGGQKEGSNGLMVPVIKTSISESDQTINDTTNTSDICQALVVDVRVCPSGNKSHTGPGGVGGGEEGSIGIGNGNDQNQQEAIDLPPFGSVVAVVGPPSSKLSPCETQAGSADSKADEEAPQVAEAEGASTSTTSRARAAELNQISINGTTFYHVNPAIWRTLPATSTNGSSTTSPPPAPTLPPLPQPALISHHHHHQYMGYNQAAAYHHHQPMAFTTTQNGNSPPNIVPYFQPYHLHHHAQPPHQAPAAAAGGGHIVPIADYYYWPTTRHSTPLSAPYAFPFGLVHPAYSSPATQYYPHAADLGRNHQRPIATYHHGPAAGFRIYSNHHHHFSVPHDATSIALPVQVGTSSHHYGPLPSEPITTTAVIPSMAASVGMMQPDVHQLPATGATNTTATTITTTANTTATDVSQLKLGYNLIPLLPISAIPTRVRQAYGMDKVWQEEFEQLFAQFVSQVVWTLVEVETNPNIRNSSRILAYKGRYIVRVDGPPIGSDEVTVATAAADGSSGASMVSVQDGNQSEVDQHTSGEDEDDRDEGNDDDDNESSWTEEADDDDDDEQIRCSADDVEDNQTGNSGQGGRLGGSNCESDCDSGAVLNSTSSGSSSETASQDLSSHSELGANQESVTPTSPTPSPPLPQACQIISSAASNGAQQEPAIRHPSPAASSNAGSGGQDPSCPRSGIVGGGLGVDGRKFPLKFRMFIDSAKVRFCCDTCGHGWTSMKGRVVFWYELFELVDGPGHKNVEGVSNLIGYCAYKLFGQQCDICKIENRFERPMWYPEEVTKVLCNLFNKIGQVYFGLRMPTIDKQRRAGKPKTSHNSLLCQACHDGVCTDRK
uniref:3CxxC-type domain-containing protein n=1 Tax=Aceria tosichella TaxID=561515 RepID=A0A6G1SQL7_9ACAR